MSWIQEHKRGWRIAELMLLLVAIIGPWTFDLIVVPSEYTCSAPAIRLEGDYCGIPMSGIWILSWLVGGLINIVVGLITGATVFTDKGSELLVSLLYPLMLLLLVLPFFSTMHLILRGDSQRRQVFQMAAWGLAAGASLLLGMIGFTRHLWVLWGICLYIALAAGTLTLELVTQMAERRPVGGR